MSDEKSSRKAVRTPYSWGLRAANRVEERISVVHNRLGFDPGKSWELFGLETYEGKMGKLSEYVHSHLLHELDRMGYGDRKAITWSWPLPGDENSPGSFDSPGILRTIYLPPRTKKPDDLIRLELVDVHSQLLGRIGFEFLRLEELLNVWKITAEDKQYIGTASMSRNLIEAVASLYSFATAIAEQWSICKMTTGSIYETSTGGQVDRYRAVEVDELRRLLWSARNELKLNDNDIKSSGIGEALAEWRHQDLFKVLKDFEIEYRREATNVPGKLPSVLVRELDKRIVLLNSSSTFKTDYELLCNVVHPSLGSFQLFSGAPGSDATYGFHHIVVGKGSGRTRITSNDPLIDGEISSFGIFCNAISESMVIASDVYVSILEFMTAIGDDIALTANIEPLSFHRTWRYPKVLKDVECLCSWKDLDVCDHQWGVSGPQLRGKYEIDLRPPSKRREK
jgi:hypothetical protein